MKNKYFFITIFSLLTSLVSCSSSDSDRVQTDSDILSSKTWVVESKILSPSIVYGGIEITDIMVMESEETRNYEFNFNADATFVLSEASGTSVLNTTWLLNSDNTQLSFVDPIVYSYPVVGDMGFSTIDIISITSSKVVGTVNAEFGGVDYQMTITFI